MAARIDLFLCLDLSGTVSYGHYGISKNKDTSLWNFVRRFGLRRKIGHGMSGVAERDINKQRASAC